RVAIAETAKTTPWAAWPLTATRGGSPGQFLLLDRADLVDPTLVPATFERRLEPELHDLVGETEPDDAPPERQDVRVVVLAGHAGGVEVVAQCGAPPAHLVRRDLLALAAPADDDAAVGSPRDHLPTHLGTHLGVVDGLLVVI